MRLKRGHLDTCRNIFRIPVSGKQSFDLWYFYFWSVTQRQGKVREGQDRYVHVHVHVLIHIHSHGTDHSFQYTYRCGYIYRLRVLQKLVRALGMQRVQRMHWVRGGSDGSAKEDGLQKWAWGAWALTITPHAFTFTTHGIQSLYKTVGFLKVL